jgi:RNA polymerase sigma-70 factor, ECF subfamily
MTHRGDPTCVRAGRNLETSRSVVSRMRVESLGVLGGKGHGGGFARPFLVGPLLGACGPRAKDDGVAARTPADTAMERYAAGDDAAFGLVYDTLAPRLYGYLLRQTRDRARAEDLLQQTLLHIHRARERFIPGADVMPWAFAIARRLVVDSVRRGRREVLTSTGETDGLSLAPGAEDLVHVNELAARIETVLARLPRSQRAAFELIKHEGLSVAEAAAVLGTTVAAVKLRAHRAYEALRGALGDVIGEFEGGKP